jgi:hypothetical protein
MLGFLTHNDSYELLIDPGAGELALNGGDIVYTDTKGVEHISHTVNDAINIWLEQRKIELVE